MIRLSRFAFSLLAVTALLAGCGSEDHETVAPKSASQARKTPDPFGNPATDPAVNMPTTVSADALSVGTVIDPAGAVQRSAGPFSVADTVHVSFPTAGREPGSPVVVYWTYQDGRTHHEERTTLPADVAFARYSFSSAQGMKSGRYNVEVQLKGRPIGIADFSVQ